MVIKGIILAGGKSTRMGTDKAELLWQGKTLLQRQYDLLVELLGPDEVWVSGARKGFPSIPDDEDAAGPLIGLRSCFNYFSKEKISFDAALIIPVDMPFLEHSHLKDLLFVADGPEAVRFQHHELPLLLKNTKKVSAQLQKLCAKTTSPQQRSMRALVTDIDLHEIKCSEERILINTNTMEDWNVALSTPNATSPGWS